MKKKLMMAVFCLLAVAAVAQSRRSCEVVSSTDREVQLHFTTPQPQVSETLFQTDTFALLTLDGYLSLNNTGRPNLPVMSQLIEAPLCSGYTIEVTSADYDVIDGAQLGMRHFMMPAQPSRSKSDRSPITLHFDSATYASNAFFAHTLASVEKVGVARDRNLATVYFSPIQYNPVTNQIIICKSAVVTVRFNGSDPVATRRMKQQYHSGAFNSGLQTINELPATKEIATASAAPIHYLIVAHSSFRGQLDQFVAWKKRKGFLVTIGYTDDANVGTSTTSIAAYIKNFYTSASSELPAPSYLLLVGDVAQIPAFDGSYNYSGSTTSYAEHVTDLYYTTWTSGDIIPDCYYGRFSARTIAELTPQIEKTLMYEQYTFADPSFLGRAVLVAGVDQGTTSDNGYTFGDPAMDYVAKTYVKSDNGFNAVTYYKNNTAFAPAGVTVTGSSQASGTAAALRTLYNQGAGWVNYTAHGDYNSWSQPSFTVSNVSSMTNAQKFGFMIGNCCLSNKFDESTCLGEALLRKSGYCGAVDYFGASNSTYWYEDFYWSVGVRSNISNTMNTSYNASHMGMYDRLFHTHNEAQTEWYTSAGAIQMAGNMAVQSTTSTCKNYYWEVYHVMGDPSVMPWLGEADVMTVQTTPAALLVGATSLNVTAVPYAYVAFNDPDGNLVAAAFANASGLATLTFDALSTPANYELVVTAQNYQPAISTFSVVPANGPYVMAQNLTVANNAALVAGQNAAFNITVANVGNQATSFSVELQANGTQLLFANGGQIVCNTILQPDSSINLTALDQASVWASVPDLTSVPVTVILRWGTQSDEQSQRTFYYSVNAPKVEVAAPTINGTVAPSQDVTLNINNSNIGHAPLTGASISLISPDPSVMVLTAPAAMATLNASTSAVTSFSLHCEASLPENGTLPLIQVIDNGSLRFVDTIMLPIGVGSMETFESNDFTTFAWQQGTNAWIITNSNTFAGTYSARSKVWNSGTGHNSTSDLSISWTASVDDSISFYYNVSSESNYDFFIFYIDGTQKMEASGNSNEWRRAAFPVSAGNHMFKFSYSKDYSSSNGSDCAWIDNITFPLDPMPRHYTIDTVCRGTEYSFQSQTILTADSAAGTYRYADHVGNIDYFLMLTVVETPQVEITADHDVIRAGENVLLSATGADRYLWSTGEQVPQVRQYPTSTTTYTVTGYRGQCSATASKTITVDGSIGISNMVSEDNILSVYPNPTTGLIYIDRTGTEAQPYVLYDIQGKVLVRSSLTAQHTTINLNGLSQGVYILRVGDQTRKVVKK